MKNMKKFFERNQLLVILFSISFTFLCIFAWWIHHINELCNYTDSSIEDKINLYSPWGDSFAPFNVIISFLSVIGLIVTIYIQMKGNREQSNSSKEQWELSYRQNFDNSFYNFVSSLNEMKINIVKSSIIIKDIKGIIFSVLGYKFNECLPLHIFRKRVNEENLESIKKKLFANPMDKYSHISKYEKNIIFMESILMQIKRIYDDRYLDNNDKDIYLNVLFSNIEDDLILLIVLYVVKKEYVFFYEIIKKNPPLKDLSLNIRKYGIITDITYLFYKINKI